jgi:hypothetical protein
MDDFNSFLSLDAYKFWSENFKWQDIGIDGRTILTFSERNRAGRLCFFINLAHDNNQQLS